ncbi:MAG: phosphate uptake regulator PhoU [Thermoplasmatales archaeon]|nr:phosphate uptake regulator PhoU [Thermoplasmatales archaeon]
MDVRRVQITGGSSFMVTLPKPWAEKVGLKKNDRVVVDQRPDGSILLTPMDLAGTRAGDRKVIDCDGIDDPEMLFRVLLGCYISGYETIEMASKGKLSWEHSATANRFTDAAIGVEIYEESEGRILIKDFIDPTEMQLQKTLGRMKVIAGNMLSNALLAADGKGQFIDRDDEIDRLNWLIARQTCMTMINPSHPALMASEPQLAQEIYAVSRSIERIGDHTCKIHRILSYMTEREKAGIRDRAEELGGEILALFNRSMDSWKAGSLPEANACIEASAVLADRCHSLLPVGSPGMNALVNSMVRICEYCGDISEHTMNASISARREN